VHRWRHGHRNHHRARLGLDRSPSQRDAELEVAESELIALSPDVVLNSSRAQPSDRVAPAVGRIESLAPELARMPTLDLLRRVRALHEKLYPAREADGNRKG
jgi:hypothetical protein